MKSYTFEIEGHADDYYRAFDIKQYFLRPVYKSGVRRAIGIVKQEIKMRQHVFKDNRVKRDQKVKDMEFVLMILSRFSDSFPELQKEMFG